MGTWKKNSIGDNSLSLMEIKTPHPSASYPEVGKSGGKGEPSSVERRPVLCYLLEEERKVPRVGNKSWTGERKVVRIQRTRDSSGGKDLEKAGKEGKEGFTTLDKRSQG